MNPSAAFATYRFSRPDPSATWVSLHSINVAGRQLVTQCQFTYALFGCLFIFEATNLFIGALGGTWTLTVLLPRDFKSLASTYSATRAFGRTGRTWTHQRSSYFVLTTFRSLVAVTIHPIWGAWQDLNLRIQEPQSCVIDQLHHMHHMVRTVRLELTTLPPWQYDTIR